MPRRAAEGAEDRANRIAEVERMLAQLKVDNEWSMTRLKSEVRERGICLYNGREYGAKLGNRLKHDHDLKVHKREVKPFRHAKTCLVKLNP